uniref:Uncharacterized protein n=1 Tax=Rhizophora mucronata TaxID=61149 RepID=A0A2P2KT69_RHIMU
MARLMTTGAAARAGVASTTQLQNCHRPILSRPNTLSSLSFCKLSLSPCVFWFAILAVIRACK